MSFPKKIFFILLFLPSLGSLVFAGFIYSSYVRDKQISIFETQLSKLYQLEERLTYQGHNQASPRERIALLGSENKVPVENISFDQHDSLLLILDSQAGLLFTQGKGADALNREKLLEKINSFQASAGTTEYQPDPKQSYLLSFRIIANAEVFLISLTPMSVVQRAFYYFLLQAVSLFFIVLGVSAFVGLLISRQLRKTFRDLLGAFTQVSKGQFHVRADQNRKDEFGQLAYGFNRMTEQLQNQMAEREKRVQLEEELSTARLVQETLFPEDQIRGSFGEVIGYYQPANMCGGDWWYAFEKDSRVYFMIADATGHGAPAALMTAAIRSALAIVSKKPDLKVSELMAALNQSLFETSRSKMHMTFFACCYDPATGTLTSANASHEHPILFRGKEEFESHYTKPGPRLGEQPGATYTESRVQLGKEDLIVLYTDGVMDLVDIQGKKLREKALMKAWLKLWKESSSPSEFSQKLDSYLSDTYPNKYKLPDDLTFVFFSPGH